ncbi:THAP domain-containing protein 2-like [Aphis craccivora]|uniref:THAP domain-containing protein 2-like n=1 Tax=Aphis craccivora TaxID=307492 RepID=A0A6G0XZC6_APHCR|nr:THAP domain-containing protein 2-like [Aphis craccivora]
MITSYHYQTYTIVENTDITVPKMSGCTALNCSNTRSKEILTKRRTIWLQNCRREKWQLINSSELCEIHFEERQFEQHHLDGLKKLKSNAIPTLFDIPNPPHLLETNRKSLYEVIESKDSDLAIFTQYY